MGTEGERYRQIDRQSDGQKKVVQECRERDKEREREREGGERETETLGEGERKSGGRGLRERERCRQTNIQIDRQASRWTDRQQRTELLESSR